MVWDQVLGLTRAGAAAKPSPQARQRMTGRLGNAPFVQRVAVSFIPPFQQKSCWLLRHAGLYCLKELDGTNVRARGRVWQEYFHPSCDAAAVLNDLAVTLVSRNIHAQDRANR